MKHRLSLPLSAFAILIMLVPLFAADPLTARKPEAVPGTQGKFDFIKIDQARHRLLACHTGNGSLDVIDVATSKLIKSVPTGGAQGIAIDDKNGLYYVSASKPPKLVMVDAAKLEVVGEVPLPGPADLVAYHPGSNRVFVCNDEKPEMWIIDPVAKKIVNTLTLPGAGMEDLGFDAQGDSLYQCLKETSELAQIDVAKQSLIDKWPTTPAEKPHGMAIIPGTDMTLIAGGTGKLVLMNLTTGKIISSADIAQRVDEIAYDPGLKRVYCASGLGTISTVSLRHKKLTPLASTFSAQGAHSVAVDTDTHTVWIAFAKDGQPFIQAFDTN